jgi:hypothetical protein
VCGRFQIVERDHLRKSEKSGTGFWDLYMVPLLWYMMFPFTTIQYEYVTYTIFILNEMHMAALKALEQT